MRNPVPPPRHPDLASWTLLGGMLALLLLLQVRDPFGVAPRAVLPPSLIAGLLAAGALAGRYRKMPRLTAASIAFLQISLFTFVGIALSYALAAQTGPLWDARLADWDRALGLDWPAIAAAVNGVPLAGTLLALVYHSLIPQMIVLVVALSTCSRFTELRISVCAALLSGLATILISGLMPAFGNLLDPTDYPNLWPSLAWLHMDVVAGLRSGSLRVIDPSVMTGIVTFPSYHAALALVWIWSFRQLPRLALPGTIWCLLTILATPLGGGHYGVDVLAGLLLGALSIVAARRLVAPAPDRTQALAHEALFSRPRLS